MSEGNCVCVQKSIETLMFPQPVYMILTIRGSSVLQEHIIEEETLAGAGHHWSGPFLYSVLFTAHF